MHQVNVNLLYLSGKNESVYPKETKGLSSDEMQYLIDQQ